LCALGPSWVLAPCWQVAALGWVTCDPAPREALHTYALLLPYTSTARIFMVQVSLLCEGMGRESTVMTTKQDLRRPLGCTSLTCLAQYTMMILDTVRVLRVINSPLTQSVRVKHLHRCCLRRMEGTSTPEWRVRVHPLVQPVAGPSTVGGQVEARHSGACLAPRITHLDPIRCFVHHERVQATCRGLIRQGAPGSRSLVATLELTL
jgi:hypothetical protein